MNDERPFGRFKNGVGAHLLKPIFYEYDNSDHLYSIYTLKDYDLTHGDKTYPSLRKLYVEMEDPTEYEFALAHLDGWLHWKKLSESSFFQPYLKEWREELEVRLRAKQIARIKQVAGSTSKEAYQAQKFLATNGWKTEEEKTRGRPSKEKIKQAAEQLFQERTVHDEDFDRLFGDSGAIQ